MRSLRRLSLCAVALVFLSSRLLLAQHAAPTVRITAPIDASQLVPIKGSVHPLANAQNDRGPASPSMQLERLHLILKRSPDQETALRQLIQEQNTPGSSDYHKWLTPTEFAAQFGPSPQDISTVEKWLSDQGFTINQLEPGNQTLDVSGSVGQLQSAFHTQVHKYMVNGQLHYANADNPAIPAALSPVVGGFVSLNNFHYRSYAKKLGEATYDPSTGQAKPSWTISGSNGQNFVLSPADYAIQYDLNPVYNTLGLKGDGQTIAIVNDSNVNIDLVNQFRTLFGLSANPPQVIIDGTDPGVDGINNPDGPNGDSVEAYLDVEWAGAVAPDATVDLVIAGDTSLENGLALAAEHAVYSNVAPVVSVSFGLCELFQGSDNAFWNNLWEQASAQGQTVLVSTGDDGSAGCDDGASGYAVDGLAVNGLASTPYDVAVGGTDFYYSGGSSQLGTYWNTTASNSTPTTSIIKSPVPEQPWNSSQYGLDLFNQFTSEGSTTTAAGGGGASSAALCSTNTYSSTTGLCTGTISGYAKPTWQTGITGIPADNVRDLPDVSLFASNGYNDSYYPICATDGDCQPASAGGTVQIYGVGGTSAAAPSFAGIMALVNQKYGRQGQADTILYPLKAQFPAAFHDVTNGNNSVPCAYSATAGSNSPNCIAVSNPVSVPVYDSSGDEIGLQLEGQIGSGTTADYNAAAGYNLATGLGTVDAATLINDWGSVKLGASSTSLTATPTSITVGSTTNGTISVSGTVTGTSPTGNVTIMTDSTEPNEQSQATFALNGSGQFSGTLSDLPGGQYNIWASYGGDAHNAASSSPKMPITVSQGASAVAFNVFANGVGTSFNSNQSSQIDYGTQLMLGAEAGPQAELSALQTCVTNQFQGVGCAPLNFPKATGTVTFKDGSTAINTAVLNSEGDAEYNAPFAVNVVGTTHSITASYSGDNSYSASTSSAITFTVVKDTPTLVLNASAVSQGAGINGPNQPLVISVQVVNTAQASAASFPYFYPVPVAAPTGTVTVTGLPSGVPSSATLTAAVDPVSVGGVYTGGTQAVEGVANFIVPAGTTSGTPNLKFTYSGDSNYNGTSTPTESLPIFNTSTDGAATPTISASLSGSISPNSTLTVIGTVTGTNGNPAPTSSASQGTGILVYASGYYINEIYFSSSTGASSSFSYTFDSGSLPQGANQITLQYTGDNVYNPVAITLNSGNPINNPLSDFSMVAQNDLVPVTSSSPGTATIGLGSINGFSGPINLSCTAAAGVSCSVSPASASLSAGGNATATLSITAPSGAANATYNVAVIGTDATGEFVHTANVQAVVTGSTAGASSFGLSASPVSLAFSAAATAGNSTTVTVVPIGNGQYSGTVGLSCSVSPSGSSSPTCGLSVSSVTLSGSYLPKTATLTMTSNGSTAGGAYTVTVSGTDTATNITSTATVQVSVGDYTVAGSGNITVNPGATSGNTATITVSPQGTFAGTVNLTCSFTSNASNDPATCTMNPASVALSGSGSQTATLSIATTAATTAMMDHKTMLWPSAGGGLVLACAVFFWIPKKRRGWLAMFVLLAFLGSVAGMACGGGGGGNSGGGSSGGGGNPGTTAGTYAVTVTATSGSLSHTATVNLTVQ